MAWGPWIWGSLERLIEVGACAHAMGNYRDAQTEQTNVCLDCGTQQGCSSLSKLPPWIQAIPGEFGVQC